MVVLSVCVRENFVWTPTILSRRGGFVRESLSLMMYIFQAGVKSMRKRVKGLVKKLRYPKSIRIYKSNGGETALQTSSDTRWNSELNMFRSVLKNKEAVILTGDSSDLNIASSIKVIIGAIFIIFSYFGGVGEVFIGSSIGHHDH